MFQDTSIITIKYTRYEMKEGIHPNYGPAKVICACGKVWDIYSTRKEQKVGICAECHPFITGKQKLVDTAGRVEKFNRRYANAATINAKKK